MNKMALPTAEDLGRAFRYIDSEWKHEGKITGEMWAEGLAFGRPFGAHTPASDLRHYVDIGQQTLPQLSPLEWWDIVYRADYLKQRG